MNSNIKSKVRAIGIYSNIYSSKHLAASFLQIRGKDYYDLNLNIEIFFKSEGIAGVAFRIHDEFNYYAFVIDRISGYKAIVKVVNSEVSILKSINDGGILIENWHTLNIKAEGPKLSAYIYDSESSHKTSSEKIIEVQDSTFMNGTVGVFVNNIKGFLFDGLKIEPLKCWSPWLPKEDLKILNSDTNIYDENFSNGFEQKYSNIDIEEIDLRDGPAQWEIVNDYIEKSYLVQKTLAFDSTSKKRPNIALINNKNFQNGMYMIEFQAMQGSKGMISIIFKYLNEVNNNRESSEQFYTFDLVNGEKESYFSLRKFNNNNVKLIKQKIITAKESFFPEKKAYKTLQTIKVIIESINEKIKIQISYDGMNYQDVIIAIEDSIKNGLVGVGTWKSSVRFTTLQLEPPKIHLTTKDIDNLSKSDSPDLPLPNVLTLKTTALKSTCINKNNVNDKPLGTILSYVSVLNSALDKDYCDNSNKSETGENKNKSNDNQNNNDEKGSNSDDANSKKDSEFISSGSWKKCVTMVNEEKRNKYCDNKSNSEITRQKCKVIY